MGRFIHRKESGTAHWVRPNTDASNESGFTSLPGGFRDYKGDFGGISYSAYFWSSSPYNKVRAWVRWMPHSSSWTYLNDSSMQSCVSVRCVKN